MPDREKVIGNLEGLTWDDWKVWHSDSEVRTIAEDAIVMLKEQEAEIRQLRLALQIMKGTGIKVGKSVKPDGKRRGVE